MVAKSKSKKIDYYLEKELTPDIPIITSYDDDNTFQILNEVKVSEPCTQIILKECKQQQPKVIKTRKPSLYNIMIGEFIKKISAEQKDLNPKQRMSLAQEMYRTWKATCVC